MNENLNEPIFYTETELLQMQTKIRYYMDNISECEVQDTDNEFIMGCKMTAIIANDAKKKNFDEKIVTVYIEYPLFLFYTDINHKVVRRIYGIAIRENGKVAAHAVTAMTMINNDIIGGIDLDECVHVKEWSTGQKEFLSSGFVVAPECFTKPFGFIGFVN